MITNGPAGATNGTVKPVPPGTALPTPIALAGRAFSHWGSAPHRWAITPGAYGVMVGTSSRDFQLQGSVNR